MTVRCLIGQMCNLRGHRPPHAVAMSKLLKGTSEDSAAQVVSFTQPKLVLPNPTQISFTQPKAVSPNPT